MKTKMKNKMMGKVILCILFTTCCLFTSVYSYSQGAAINTTGASADPSAMLDVSGTSSGVLFNRMTEAQKNVIVSPANGLLIYQTDNASGFWYFNGTAWKFLGSDNLGNHTATQILDMSTKKIIDVATCTQNLDAANKEYVDSTVAAGGGGGGGGTCQPGAAGVISGTSSVCQGQSSVNYFVDTIANATGYVWTLPPGAVIVSCCNTNSIAVNFLGGASSGKITVRGTSASCNGAVSPSYAVTVNSPPVAPVASNSGPVCTGSALNLTASNISGATYSWTGPNGFTSTDQNPSISSASMINAGTYSVIATVNGCVSAAGTTSVTINPIPASTFDHTLAHTTLPVTFIPTITGATYNWTFTSGTPATNTLQNPAVIWSTVGTYNVTLTVTFNGCTSSTTNAVNVVDRLVQTFTVAGGGQQTFTVPLGITSVIIDVYGAQGQNSTYGGKGGEVKGTLAVIPGQVLNVFVGYFGGWNGSGSGWQAGGGASDVRILGTDLASRIIIAGGGGGSGNVGSVSPFYYGGAGGANTGGTGTNNNTANGGGGGTQSSGGAGGSGTSSGDPGTLGQGGNGGAGYGGGGGGGFYGGGGGGYKSSGDYTGGGGGGSNWISPSFTNTTNMQGVQSGHGQVIFTW